MNDNYITFYFKGGAADIGRRSRRALMIAQILKKLDFKVEQKSDMVRGEMKKYEEIASWSGWTCWGGCWDRCVCSTCTSPKTTRSTGTWSSS